MEVFSQVTRLEISDTGHKLFCLFTVRVVGKRGLVKCVNGIYSRLNTGSVLQTVEKFLHNTCLSDYLLVRTLAWV